MAWRSRWEGRKVQGTSQLSLTSGLVAKSTSHHLPSGISWRRTSTFSDGVFLTSASPLQKGSRSQGSRLWPQTVSAEYQARACAVHTQPCDDVADNLSLGCRQGPPQQSLPRAPEPGEVTTHLFRRPEFPGCVFQSQSIIGEGKPLTFCGDHTPVPCESLTSWGRHSLGCVTSVAAGALQDLSLCV